MARFLISTSPFPAHLDWGGLLATARRLARLAVLALPALILPVLILVALRFGFATPTEIAVMAVLYALVMSTFLYRDMSWGRFRKAMVDAGIATVFQDLALWPHLTLRGNLDFVLEARGVTDGGRRVKPCGFQVHKGEIFGIGGLAGQGKLGLPNGIMGLYPGGGEVLLRAA